MRTLERGLTDKLQMQWSQNTDVIRDNLLQDALLLKGTKTNCPYMLMPKVYGFL